MSVLADDGLVINHHLHQRPNNWSHMCTLNFTGKCEPPANGSEQYIFLKCLFSAILFCICLFRPLTAACLRGEGSHRPAGEELQSGPGWPRASTD